MQQSSSNIYLYCMIAGPLYFLMWNRHFWLSFGMDVKVLNRCSDLNLNLPEVHMVEKKT